MIKNVFFCIEFFIDSAGFVHFLGRDLTITSFQAYEIRVSHFYQLKQQNFLFTVGVSFQLTFNSIWHLCIKSNQVFFNFDKLYKSKWQMCTNLLRGAQLPYTHTHTQLHHLNSGSHGQLFYPSFSSKLQSEISCRYLYLYTNNEIDIFPPPRKKKPATTTTAIFVQ